MSEPFKMPEVEVGQVVHWYPDGDLHQKPHAAIVSGLGFDSVVVNIADPASYNFRIRDGVRHVSDPRTKSDERRNDGGWDHTPQTKLLLRLGERLAALEDALGEGRGKPAARPNGAVS